MKRLAPKQRMILAAYSAEFNLAELEKINEPVQAGEEEGAKLFEGFEADMESTIETWAPLLGQWESEQKAREEAAFMELANTIVDSVTVDGKSLRDIYGSPENWFMARNPKNAKSIRSVVLQEGGENVKLSFEGPSEQEFNAWLESIRVAAGAIGDQLETIGNEYKTKSDELNRVTGNALEPVGEDVEDLLNWVGDDVKALTESIMEGVSVNLASKNQPAQASTKSNSGYYAGAASGFFGVLAVAAVVAACNKKKTVHSTEESLL
jgi:hypothetical protein